MGMRNNRKVDGLNVSDGGSASAVVLFSSLEGEGGRNGFCYVLYLIGDNYMKKKKEKNIVE